MVKYLILSIALTGCVSPSQMMVRSDGATVRCAASGFGYIGAPLAEHSFHTCVDDFQKLGYKAIEAKD